MLRHHDPSANGYGPGVVRDVLRREYLGQQRAHGFAPACGRYLLHLVCGHTQDRVQSKAFVKRAKCFECYSPTGISGEKDGPG